ncbi:MAG: hypothetical protein E6Q67_07555 [Roseateles sp.]|nr:MAG: hypothetical protein E6Q67_07555 [Roseateles sp.]
MFAPMDDPFIQLDRAEIADKLRLTERGEQQGRINLPASTLRTLDNVEAEVASFIDDHHSRAQIDAANSIRSYDERLNGLTLLTKLSSISTQARVAITDFHAEVMNCSNRLSNSRDAIEASYGELRAFRRQNGLERPAYAAPPPLSTYGTIAFSWMIETTINAFLLRLNDSMGYLGGVVAAATVGAINVGFAAFVGRQVWPRTHLRNLTSRVLGWVGVAVWIAFLLLWNLMAAHYRDAKSLGIDQPEHAALGMLGSGLDSIYSYGLLVAGLAFAVIAAGAGYRMDDPYPGYGERARRHEERCEDYAHDVRVASDEVLEIRNVALKEAIEVREGLERQLRERAQILSARDAFRRRYEEYATQLEQTANALLQEYRTANIANRTTPAPAHFDERWALPRVAVPPAPESSVGEKDVEAAEKALDAAVAEISRACEAAIASFEPLDKLKRSLDDG